MALGEELVTILDNLMGTADQVHVVFLQETRDDIGAKRETDTSVVLAPTSDILVGVGPQQIAEQAAVRNLCNSIALVNIARCRQPPKTKFGRIGSGRQQNMKKLGQAV